MSEAPAIRVLLIEDDEDVRVSTTQVLTLAGFEVESFPSAERARAHISFGVPAVVISDVRLPGLSGTEWLPELRNVDAELPVILVTGHGHIAMAVQAMREGAYDFIEKPFSSERLVAIVRHAIERRQLSLQVRALRDALENWQGIQSVLIGRSARRRPALMNMSHRTELGIARHVAAHREPWSPARLREVAGLLAEAERVCDGVSDFWQGRLADHLGFWRRVPGTAWYRPAPRGQLPDVPAADECAWKLVELRDALARIRRGDRA